MDIRFFLFLFALKFASAQLENETAIGGAGVRGRLSQKGVNYLARIITNTLLPQLASAEIDFEPSFIHLPAEKISITSMRLLFQNNANTVLSRTFAPNNVHIEVQGMGITGKSELSVPGVPTTVIAEVFAKTVTVSLNVSVLRTLKGAPRLDINDCKIMNQSNIEAKLSEGSPTFKDENLKQQLKNSLIAQGGEVFQRMVCNRISVVIEDRVNKRFNFLPTKLTLAKVSDDVTLKGMTEQMRSSRNRRATENGRMKKTVREKRAALLSSFNVSRAHNLFLDYALVSDPWVSDLGLELESKGEVSIKGLGGTPFGPVKIPFPEIVNEEYMLQMAISDYMTNSLLYHGHKIGLFNTRVDPKTPHFGPIMRTSCSLSTQLMFCLGDLFPTLRKVHPDHRLALFFDTVQAPVIQFRPPSSGGITFSLLGKIVFLLISQDESTESKVAEMEIDVKSHMKMRLSNTDIKPKITLDSIKLTTLSPSILLQGELDQAVMLAREVLQRMVNDILSDGIPVPLHPLFKLNKPKIKILERALLLQTNFGLNEDLLQKLTSENVLDGNLPANLLLLNGTLAKDEPQKSAAELNPVNSGSVSRI